jgi:adenosylmethionine-8-amino-7-oxononanoate aminotransferase
MADQMSNAFPADSIETKDLKFLVHPVTNLPLHHQTGPMVLERAKGIYVWDNHGKQYLEGLAGLWCTALGYGEDELIRAAEQQLRKLSYSQLFGSRTSPASCLQKNSRIWCRLTPAASSLVYREAMQTIRRSS